MFEIKEGTTEGALLSSLLFNTILQNSLKDDIQRWQKKKGMGIYLSDNDHDCFPNLRFAENVLLFATCKYQLQKMMYEFKERVGLRIHPGKTKVLSYQSSTSPDSKKEMQIGDVKIEIPTKSESVRYLGQLITFQHQETTNQKSYQDSLGDVSQKQAGADFKQLLAQTPSPTVRRSNNSDDMLRIGNMGTHQRTRKNDTIDATQNAPSHHTNIQKIAKHKVKTSEDINDIDSSCIGDESEDGKSDTSQNDQDSDVSFEEIDAAEIEEEDCVEYI